VEHRERGRTRQALAALVERGGEVVEGSSNLASSKICSMPLWVINARRLRASLRAALSNPGSRRTNTNW
jgi:hypothetical protein